jgi:hypothetical protein
MGVLNEKRCKMKITWVFTLFYDMDGEQSELCYETVDLSNNTTCSIRKSVVDELYTKLIKTE